MTLDQVKEFRAFAERLADAAAEQTLANFRRELPVEGKQSTGAFDPVTEADRAAESVVRRLIEQQYPDHGIRGEEFGVKPAATAFEWVIDPIDGTRSYLAGLPTWGTLIALCDDGYPIIGVIDQAFLGERYLGYPGGAELNGKPLRTRVCKTLAQATLSTTDPDLFDDQDSAAFIRLKSLCRTVRYGLDCYAYAMLACGFIDVVAESGLKAHDMMALLPVIRGAGGSVTNWRGEKACADDKLLALGDERLLDTAVLALSSQPVFPNLTGRC